MSNQQSDRFWEQVEEHLQEDDICEQDRDTILSDPDLASEYLHKGKDKLDIMTREEYIKFTKDITPEKEKAIEKYIEETGKREEMEMAKLDAQDQLQEMKFD